MMVQWRDFLIGEIQDKLRKNNHNFFEASNEAYEKSMLKRIISRFDYILNTYLRDFVRTSINDYVEFIKLFTIPKYQNGELWPINSEPMIVIHLSIQKKSKSKKADKKAVKEKKEGESGEEEEDEDKTKVIYKPSIEECKYFVLNSMDMIIKSTNMINDLESDLMPFLQKTGSANFHIDQEFPWIKDATANLLRLISENIQGPNDLLAAYSKYDYILNVDRKELIDNLFKTGEKKNEKVPLEQIRDEIIHYDKAYYEIMTLSEEDVNFRIFRVIAKKLKQELGD